jgi:sugar phosphate isomerase/epimerase
MVHAKTYEFQKNGQERSIDFGRCFRLLRDANFDGPVVAEYDGNGDQLLGSLKTKSLVERAMGMKRARP